jgi:HPt (histidine-containing phosphotransfer) domain-containing protein
MPEPLDPAALAGLHELSGGDPEFVADLIDEYLTESAELLARLPVASGEELVRAAHTLKSTSATFGADALAETCARIERRDGAPAGELAAVAEREYAGVRVALLAERKRLAS